MEHEHPVPQEADPHYMQGFYRGRYNQFCVNGDFFHPGKRILFNPRHFRDFPHYMDYLTDQLKPAFGAVRRICTPNHGRRVRSLEDLRSGGVYVAAGVEKFKPYGYAQIDPNPKKAHARSYDVEPGHNRRYQVSGKYKKIDTHGKIIKCWANGNETTGPRTVLLPAYRNKPITLDAVVEQVSMVLSEECNGPVEKLYLPNGIKVMSLDQILPNAHYVALRRHDIFKRAHYKEVSLPNLRTSPRLERKSVLPPLPRSNKTSSHSSPEHSYASNNGYRRERARREEDQVFHARPVKHKRSSEKTRQVDYDQDNGGVFKAKNPNQATRGARQIDDSRQTRTDLPLDRRQAEEVQDEEDQYSSPRNGWREHGDYRDQDELKGKDKKDKKGKKDEGSGPPEPQRAYRANARRNQSPGGDQARREAEREARARREAEDRERADKARQQREAAQQKKREKEEQRKREEEEAKRKKEAEKQEQEERKRREQEERQRREEEERRWREEEEEEERRRGGAADASTPNRYEDERSARASSPRMTPISDNRSATHVLHDDQQRLAQEEEWAATRIQAGFRGYQARRDLRSQQAGDDYYGAPDSRDGPGRTDDQQDWGPGPDHDDLDQDRHAEEKAATTLQAGFRGYKARQEVRKMRHNQEVMEGSEPRYSPAPPRSPSPLHHADNNLTGSDAQYDLTGSDAEHAAAARIQASFRGHQTRRELAAQAENEAQAHAEHQAATRIQAGFRGHQTRKELAAMRGQDGGEPGREDTQHSINNTTQY